MAILFGVDIQGLIATQLGGLLLPFTFQKLTPGAIDPSDPTAGNAPTFTPYSVSGTTDNWKVAFVKGVDADLVRTVTFDAILILGTLTSPVVPAPGDMITATHPQTGASVTGVIELDGVKTDPAGATATCSCAAMNA